MITLVEMGPLEASEADALRADPNRIAKAFDVDVKLSLVLPNKLDTRTNLTEEYLDAFREEYPEAIAPQIMHLSHGIRNAAKTEHTTFALTDPSGTADRAPEAYTQAAEVLVNRLDAGRRVGVA